MMPMHISRTADIAIFGMSSLISCITTMFLSSFSESLGFSLIIVPFISASFGFFVGEGRVVRRVAKTDLVEIKKYDWPRSVTVVLDDERFNINKDSTFRKVG